MTKLTKAFIHFLTIFEITILSRQIRKQLQVKASSERKGIDAEAKIFALVTGKNAIWEKMTKKKSNIQSVLEN